MGSSSSKPETMADQQGIRDFIDKENSTHQVVIYSKSYCPYCSRTKQLFAGMNGVQVQVHELDRLPDGQKIQSMLANMTGQRTVPNVFVNNQHVGGNDDCQQANRDGSLAKLLSK